MKYLIIGLGNIGEDYVTTRHNIGFKIADNISEKIGSEFELKKHAFYAQGKFKGRNIYVIKPSNFVNNSGKAVQYWSNELKIKLENILVNNNLKSSNYARLRFGIDNNFRPGYQSDYVLGDFSKEEQKNLIHNIELSSEIVLNFCHIGIDRTMNKYN